jgi:hypothetical protein
MHRPGCETRTRRMGRTVSLGPFQPSPITKPCTGTTGYTNKIRSDRARQKCRRSSTDVGETP